jgi:alpha-beta hydrolase superfamily lysophospholipase
VKSGLSRRLLFLLIACLAVLALMWAAASLIARPMNRSVADPLPPGRLVRFTASDGVSITGSYWPGATPEAPAILLLHGINSDRDMFTEQARWLHDLGYAALAIDFRGHGASGEAERSFGWNEGRDAAAALRFLRSRNQRRKVAVIGASLGGAAALLGEGAPLKVQAMVLHAVYPDIRRAIANRIARFSFPAFASLTEPLLSYQSYLRYGVAPERIAPIQGIGRYKGEVLVIGGSEDRATTAEDTNALFKAAASRSKQLWLLQGADHAAATKLWNEQYRRRLLSLFRRTLGEPRVMPARGATFTAARKRSRP